MKHLVEKVALKRRKDFPIVNGNNNNLIYLDHAATSQKPQEVIDTLKTYYSQQNANVHRGAHQLSSIATEAFEKDFQINVTGAINSLKSVLSRLSASGNASVVFFSTVAVQTGMPFHSSVAASKGAIEGLTRSLAAEFAPKIRVNAIAPSLVNTPLASKFLNNESKIEKANERHPLGRIGNAKEIAQAAGFLLGPESSWMTGRVLQLDGGIGNLKT